MILLILKRKLHKFAVKLDELKINCHLLQIFKFLRKIKNNYMLELKKKFYFYIENINKIPIIYKNQI